MTIDEAVVTLQQLRDFFGINCSKFEDSSAHELSLYEVTNFSRENNEQAGSNLHSYVL